MQINYVIEQISIGIGDLRDHACRAQIEPEPLKDDRSSNSVALILSRDLGSLSNRFAFIGLKNVHTIRVTWNRQVEP